MIKVRAVLCFQSVFQRQCSKDSGLLRETSHSKVWNRINRDYLLRRLSIMKCKVIKYINMMQAFVLLPSRTYDIDWDCIKTHLIVGMLTALVIWKYNQGSYIVIRKGEKIGDENRLECQSVHFLSREGTFHLDSELRKRREKCRKCLILSLPTWPGI